MILIYNHSNSNFSAFKALVLDMAGEGVTWDNLWNGPGIPFGGSLIMMAFDTVLYALLAYYLDAVIPSINIDRLMFYSFYSLVM